MAEFREEDHPRAEDGKFTSGSGESKKEPSQALKNYAKDNAYKYDSSFNPLAYLEQEGAKKPTAILEVEYRDENGNIVKRKYNYTGSTDKKDTQWLEDADKIAYGNLEEGEDVMNYKLLPIEEEKKSSSEKDNKVDKNFDDVSDEDIMTELSDGGYYYGNLGEQEIYDLMAKRLDITPKRAEEGLKNQGFNFEEYQKYINGEEN